ncbi:hypothetical protein C8R42DRAFT_654102 [Lentinula raphanica]|nr:hypothetical protein C8R42DRAFT_654102 [Lentinula raphanica]
MMVVVAVRVRTILVEFLELHFDFFTVVAVVMRTTLLHLHLELFLAVRMFMVVVVVLMTLLDFDLDLLLLTMVVVVVVVMVVVMLFTEVLVAFEALKVGSDRGISRGRSRRSHTTIGHRTTSRERGPSQGTRLSVPGNGQRNGKSGRSRSYDDDCSKDRARMNHRRFFRERK